MLLCADYILPVTAKPIEGGAVLVRDDRILDLGKADVLKARYPEEEVKDYGLAALMPGLIDLHTDLESSVLRGMVDDVPYAQWMNLVIKKGARLSSQDWYNSAVLGGLEALSAGITCLADLSSTGAVLRACQSLGLRSTIYREVCAMDKRRIDFAMEAAKRDVEQWQREANPKLTRIGLAPSPIFVCHPAIFRLVSEYATEHGLPVAMHLAASREEFDFVRRGTSTLAVHKDETHRGYVEVPPWLPTGVTPVNYALNWGAFDSPEVMIIHGIHVTDEDISKLVDRNVSVAVCPRSNAQLGMGVAPVEDYVRAGLRVGFGTDSPAATDSTDMLTEMRIGMLVQRAVNKHFLDAHTALKLATIGAAAALNMDDKIGSLEIGKQADIIAVDLSGSHQALSTDPVSSVVNTASGTDVVMTMIDGVMRYEKNQWNVDVEVAKHVASIISVKRKLRG